MRINDSFVLRRIHHIYMLIPIKYNDVSNNVISLNNTAAQIFLDCIHHDNAETLSNAISIQYGLSEIDKINIYNYISSLIENRFLFVD